MNRYNDEAMNSCKCSYSSLHRFSFHRLSYAFEAVIVFESKRYAAFPHASCGEVDDDHDFEA